MKRLIQALFCSLVFVTASKAEVIQLNGSIYEIETVTGLLSEYRSTIESQVWYGNSELAREFSNEVGELMGAPNFGQLGPMFGFDVYDGVGADYTRSWVYKPNNFHLEPDNRAQMQNAAAGVYFTYATGRYLGVSAIPEPSTILLTASAILLLIGRNAFRVRDGKLFSKRFD